MPHFLSLPPPPFLQHQSSYRYELDNSIYLADISRVEDSLLLRLHSSIQRDFLMCLGWTGRQYNACRSIGVTETVTVAVITVTTTTTAITICPVSYPPLPSITDKISASATLLNLPLAFLSGVGTVAIACFSYPQTLKVQH